MSLVLSRMMRAAQLGGVSHVAKLFYRCQNRFTPREEAEDLHRVGSTSSSLAFRLMPCEQHGQK